MMGNDTTVEGDRVRTRYSLDILERQKPGFFTIHLSSLDESEHESGPFSPDANKTLEAIDSMVAQLIDCGPEERPQNRHRHRLRSRLRQRPSRPEYRHSLSAIRADSGQDRCRRPRHGHKLAGRAMGNRRHGSDHVA